MSSSIPHRHDIRDRYDRILALHLEAHRSRIARLDRLEQWLTFARDLAFALLVILLASGLYLRVTAP